MTVICRVFDEEPRWARTLSHCRRREKFARDIKEKLCYVARVYDTELRASQTYTSSLSLKRLRCVKVLIQPSFTVEEACGFRDTSFQKQHEV